VVDGFIFTESILHPVQLNYNLNNALILLSVRGCGPAVAEAELSGPARLQNHRRRRPQCSWHRAQAGGKAGAGMDEWTVAAGISRFII
jgi:hypothetical protein